MKTSDTINLPRESFNNLIKAMEFFEVVQDNIEDFLIMKDKKILSKLKKSKKEQKEGKVCSFDVLKDKYV